MILNYNKELSFSQSGVKEFFNVLSFFLIQVKKDTKELSNGKNESNTSKIRDVPMFFSLDASGLLHNLIVCVVLLVGDSASSAE